MILYRRSLYEKYSNSEFFSGPHVSVFGLNMEICFVNLRIDSEYREIRTKKALLILTLFTQW